MALRLAFGHATECHSVTCHVLENKRALEIRGQIGPIPGAGDEQRGATTHMQTCMQSHKPYYLGYVVPHAVRIQSTGWPALLSSSVTCNFLTSRSVSSPLLSSAPLDEVAGRGSSELAWACPFSRHSVIVRIQSNGHECCCSHFFLTPLLYLPHEHEKLLRTHLPLVYYLLG